MQLTCCTIARFLQSLREIRLPKAAASREDGSLRIESHCNSAFFVPSLLPLQTCSEGTAHCMTQSFSLDGKE